MNVAVQPGSEQIRDWMKRREFRNEEAATYLGIDAAVMTKLANGSRNAGLKIALIIERKTGIPVEAWASDDADISRLGLGTNRRKRQ